METEDENAIIAALDYRDEYGPTLFPAAVITGAQRKQTRTRLVVSGAVLATAGVAAGAVLTVGGTSGSGSAADTAAAAGKQADPAVGGQSPVIKLSPGQRITLPGASGTIVWFTDKHLCVADTNGPTFKTGDCAPGHAFEWVDGVLPQEGNTAGAKTVPTQTLGNSIVAAPGGNGYVYGVTLSDMKPTLAIVTGGDGKTHVATIVEAASGQAGLAFFTPEPVTTAAVQMKTQPEPVSGPMKVDLFSANGGRLCTIGFAPPGKSASC